MSLNPPQPHSRDPTRRRYFNPNPERLDVILYRCIAIANAPVLPAAIPRFFRLQAACFRILRMSENARLERVLAQLRLYEHPLLNFSARPKADGVEVIIKFKDESVPVHTYYFDLHPRDLDDPQFEWSFQRQLYDALHDYFVEMFIRTPQDRADRQRKGL